MIIAGAVGFIVGGFCDDCFGRAILFAIVAGIACVVYTIDNQNK